MALLGDDFDQQLDQNWIERGEAAFVMETLLKRRGVLAGRSKPIRSTPGLTRS